MHHGSAPLQAIPSNSRTSRHDEAITDDVVEGMLATADVRRSTAGVGSPPPHVCNLFVADDEVDSALTLALPTIHEAAAPAPAFYLLRDLVLSIRAAPDALARAQQELERMIVMRHGVPPGAQHGGCDC
mmetsp:Transcript_14818/g.39887  ORF Transcript_14818/g.39887 Transcript_14818/m.39887 type:complete len:129 (+) Transcript_14818:501-887(+)